MRWNTLTGIAAVAAVCMIAAIPISAQNRWGASYFPNVTLTTQDGATVRFYDDLIKGKIVAINLIYTTCQYACPLETARLAQVHKVLGDRMGRDVFFYSITIDPDHDTPAVLKEYAEKYHAGPGWVFLTGKQADIDLISRKIGLYSAPNPANPDGHTPNLLVGNEVTGQWMRNSGLDNPKFLARTIGDWLNSWQAPRKALKSYAEAPQLTLDRGEYTFRNHCAACHTVGRGEHIGPDLLGVTTIRDRAWLLRFIVAPDQMLEQGDPIARALFAKYKNVRMPNLGLTGGDAAVLVDYLEKQAAAAPPPAAGTATAKPIVDLYLRIQEALSADSVDGIKDAARSVASEATKFGSSGEPIRSAAGEVQQARDLKAARAAFGTLGDAIMIHAKATAASLEEDVKVAYCPMLRKYWLQKGTTIQNPFYGKDMLECGRIIASRPAVAK